MQAIKGGWVGQTFALPANNDTGGKRSRSRRPKEERKIMIESFINKYQKSNNGNFPSLNLTQKEVGGSFYTVREIFREIIQENRVLASPKVSLEEHSHSGFLKQHQLGSISIEPQNDFFVSDKHHFVTSIELNEYQIMSEELDSSSGDEFENEKVVNVGEGLEENIDSDERFTTTAVIINHQDDNADLSSQNIHISGSQGIADEQYLSKNYQIVDKTKESGEEIYTETIITSAKDRGRDVGESEADIAVETFPLRPVCGTIVDLDGESGKLHKANKHGTATLVENNDLVDEKDLEQPLDSTMESNGELKDGKVVQNLQEPSFENSKLYSSLTDETKANSSTQQSISEDFMAFITKSGDQDKTLRKKGNNLTLERLNLETWERTSKKSNSPEHNPLLTFVKTVISAFVKFWTE